MQKDGTTGLTDRESPPEMHRTFLQYQGLTLQSYEQMFINRNKISFFLYVIFEVMKNREYL